MRLRVRVRSRVSVSVGVGVKLYRLLRQDALGRRGRDLVRVRVRVRGTA